MNVIQKVYLWAECKTGIFNSVIEALPAVILITAVYWFIRRAWHKKKLGADFKELRKKCRLNETVRLLCVAWIAGIFMFVLIPYFFWGDFWNWVAFGSWPERNISFRFIGYGIKPRIFSCIEYYKKYGELGISNGAIIEWLINIALFVPLGVALPIVWKKANFPKTILVGSLCTLFIELVQPFIWREGDINDAICNAFGAVLGYLLFLLLKKIFPKFIEKCKTDIRGCMKSTGSE